jgi:dihydrofolate synthase/folylpolyglutamate synthase
VLDGAHNPAGARALAASLEAYFGEAPATFVVGVLRDKDAVGILRPLLGRARRVVLTAFDSPRAAAPDALRALVPRSVPAVVAPSVGAALRIAEEGPGTPIVCVAGSLALVGDALRHLDGGDRPCPVEGVPDT